MASSASTRTLPCSHFSTFPVPTVASRPIRAFVAPTRHQEPNLRLRIRPKRTVDHRPSVCLSSPSSESPCGLSASERLARLVSEFRALSEPIDRVKHLLHYAEILPGFEESGRVEANRVAGCTSQVWLDVRFVEGPSSGERGGWRVRFRADSDSEITKGFCSCLIRVLDGATPEEVMAVEAEDLGPMNMGVVAHSRVNTWHNVLMSMQRRTEELLLVINAEEMQDANGSSHSEALQEQ